MRLLLDTHIFLWYIAGDTQLADAWRQMIGDPQNQVFLSVVSLWEAIIKFQTGRLPLPEAPETYIPRMRAQHRFIVLPVDEASVAQVALLPLIHRDPFDRLLIGQAIQNGLTLITSDAAIRAYPTAPII